MSGKFVGCAIALVPGFLALCPALAACATSAFAGPLRSADGAEVVVAGADVERKTPAQPTAFKLESADVSSGVRIGAPFVFRGFGCEGGNLSPALAWSGAPARTRSFAVMVHDADAPVPSGWWHWMVVNLPATVTALPRGAGTVGSTALPAAALQVRNDYGEQSYGGPCPPVGHGDHRYRFTVLALDTDRVDFGAQPSPAKAAFLLRAHTLATAEMEARYGR